MIAKILAKTLSGLLATLLIATTTTAQDCPEVKLSDFPKKDLPTAADKAALAKQRSCDYYYGIGKTIDYVKARKLAFMEMAASGKNEGVFEGASILLMIYANGFGVQRDLPLCIRLACANVDGAQAEIEGRIQHLKDLQQKPSTDTFDICNDITSGFMEGYCQSIRSEMAGIRRTAAIDAVLKTWPKKDTLAFGYLRLAASAFFEEKANLETDLSGTARVAISLNVSDELEESFKTQILQAGKCDFTQYTDADFAKADKELNTVYVQVMKSKETAHEGEGFITRDGIRKTQRKWIAYRDAWVVFGGTRCPAITAISWKTLLTNERIAQLKQLLEDE